MLTFQSCRVAFHRWWRRVRRRDCIEYLIIAMLLLGWAVAKGWGH